MKLLITIDTECDNAWLKGSGVTTENVKFLPRFQQLCDRFCYKPTYLVSYEMANDGFFREFASDALRSGTCEIGSHPHPWNSPPNYKLTSNDTKIHPFLIEYPPGGSSTVNRGPRTTAQAGVSMPARDAHVA